MFAFSGFSIQETSPALCNIFTATTIHESPFLVK